MPAEICLPQIQGCAIRVAILDTDGTPLAGDDNLYVSDALTEMTVTPVYSDGAHLEDKNACGALCLVYDTLDNLLRADGAITICSHDPYLISFLSDHEVITDGEAIGTKAPAIGPVGSKRVSIEVWAKRILDGELDPDFPYAWWAYPLITRMRKTERKFANEQSKPAFTFKAYQNPNWFDGPANDWPATSDRYEQWIPTTTLPDVFCGPQALAVS